MRFFERERVRVLGVSMLVGLAALALYAATAQRGISWQDSGEYQYKFLVGAYDWEVGAGIARLHPTYILLTRLLAACLPGVGVPYVYTLSSGVGMALALAALVLTVYSVTRSMRAGCLAAALLGGAHMAWWLSTMAEVYTWSLAFLMLELACLVRSLQARSFAWYAGALFFNGCHFGVHNFALLNLPVYAVLFLLLFRRKAWHWGVCAAIWVVGALPVLVPIVRYGLACGSLEAVIRSALFGEVFQHKILAVDVRNGPLWGANMALSSCSFMNPCWLYAALVPLAAWRGRRKAGSGPVTVRGQHGTLLALTVVHALFWVRYLVPDQATFILPTLGLLAVWAGLGAARVLHERPGWFFAASLAISMVCSMLVPHVACLAAERLLPPRSRVLPFRNEFAYWAYPWKHNEDSAERFVDAVARERYPDEMVAWVDTTGVAPLMAAQALGRLPATWRWLTFWQNEPDREIVRQLRASPDGGYVLSPIQCYVPEAVLKQAAAFEQRGILYRIVW